MKCAAFWFTKKWTVDTAYVKEGLRRTVRLDLTRIRETQSTRIPVDERPVDPRDHGTTIRLEGVDERMPKAGPTMAKVREFLADISRVPIRDGLFRLEVNGEECTTKRNAHLSSPNPGLQFALYPSPTKGES